MIPGGRFDDLPTLALNFSRSCLGWHSPEFGESPNGRKYVRQLTPTHFDNLYFDELGSVMRHVRDWSDQSGRDITIRYAAAQGGYGVFCEGVDTWDRSLAVAVLSACVGAAA